MTRIILWWHRCWSRLGIAGACGAAAVLAAGWIHVAQVQERQEELAALQARAEQPAASAGARSEAGAASRPAAFGATFPQAGTLPDWLERIEAAGAATGVTVERTEYRAASDAPATLARYQIALPVKGTYPQVRAFMAALLQEVPTLAVTDIDVKREAIGTAAVEARLNLSVYLQAVQR